MGTGAVRSSHPMVLAPIRSSVRREWNLFAEQKSAKVRKAFENGKLLKLQIAGDPQNNEIRIKTTNGSRSPKMIQRGKQFCTLSEPCSNIYLNIEYMNIWIFWTYIVRSMFKYIQGPGANASLAQIDAQPNGRKGLITASALSQWRKPGVRLNVTVNPRVDTLPRWPAAKSTTTSMAKVWPSGWEELTKTRRGVGFGQIAVIGDSTFGAWCPTTQASSWDLWMYSSRIMDFPGWFGLRVERKTASR